jgi:hypothetical protein
MRVLLVVVVVITLIGVLTMGSMFVRNDSRLGMSALAILMTGDVMAMVYAAMDAG